MCDFWDYKALPGYFLSWITHSGESQPPCLSWAQSNGEVHMVRNWSLLPTARMNSPVSYIKRDAPAPVTPSDNCIPGWYCDCSLMEDCTRITHLIHSQIPTETVWDMIKVYCFKSLDLDVFGNTQYTWCCFLMVCNLVNRKIKGPKIFQLVLKHWLFGGKHMLSGWFYLCSTYLSSVKMLVVGDPWVKESFHVNGILTKYDFPCVVFLLAPVALVKMPEDLKEKSFRWGSMRKKKELCVNVESLRSITMISEIMGK